MQTLHRNEKEREAKKLYTGRAVIRWKRGGGNEKKGGGNTMTLSLAWA